VSRTKALNSATVQILVAILQALAQAIGARLEGEQRVLLVASPDDFTTDEERAALEIVRARARYLRVIGEETPHG